MGLQFDLILFGGGGTPIPFSPVTTQTKKEDR